MPLEIEKKFLMKNSGWRDNAEGVLYKQGYIVRTPQKSVRIRTFKNRGYITIKGSKAGITRSEFEYEIPFAEATELLNDFCEKKFIEKTRYKIEFGGKLWEIDEFHGDNNGLIIAEIELNSPDEKFSLPPWIGEEVSHDSKYFNSNLIDFPYSKW